MSCSPHIGCNLGHRLWGETQSSLPPSVPPALLQPWLHYKVIPCGSVLWTFQGMPAMLFPLLPSTPTPPTPTPSYPTPPMHSLPPKLCFLPDENPLLSPKGHLFAKWQQSQNFVATLTSRVWLAPKPPGDPSALHKSPSLVTSASFELLSLWVESLLCFAELSCSSQAQCRKWVNWFPRKSCLRGALSPELHQETVPGTKLPYSLVIDCGLFFDKLKYLNSLLLIHETNMCFWDSLIILPLI